MAEAQPGTKVNPPTRAMGSPRFVDCKTKLNLIPCPMPEAQKIHLPWAPPSQAADGQGMRGDAPELSHLLVSAGFVIGWTSVTWGYMGNSEIRAIGGSGTEAALNLPQLEHVPELLRDLSPALASFSHPLAAQRCLLYLQNNSCR